MTPELVLDRTPGTVDAPTFDASTLLRPERGKEESFKEYKQRQKEAALYVKVVGSGKTFWDTRQQGTYRKPKV